MDLLKKPKALRVVYVHHPAFRQRATVRIEDRGRHGIWMCVRPYRSRTSYDRPLGDVAYDTMWKVAKAGTGL